MSGYNNEQLDRLEPAYLASLGLQQAPFTSDHENKFLYLDAEREQRDNLLHHLSQYRNLLLIVTGECGMGKTSLLQHFVNTANEEWSLCKVQANAMMDAHQLLASIARNFGLQVSNQSASVLQETLYQYLVAIQRNGQIPILLVDDAHELPKDALETLFTLADTETSEDSLLRIILFCEPQIEIMLESPAIQPLRERITHTIDIPAFNEEQTAEYIKHRLAVCGFTGTSPFQPKDIKKIFKVSRGIPAHINELAHLHLNGERYITSEPDNLPDEYIQLSYSKKRLAVGIVVITVVVAALLSQEKINGLFNEPVTDKPAVITKLETTIAPSLPDTPVIKEKTIKLTPEPKPEIIEETATPVTPAVNSQIRSILPNPVTGSRQQQAILINGKGFSKNTRITVHWPGHKKQLDPSQVFYENSNQLRIQISVGNKADNWTIQANDPVHGLSNSYRFKVTDAPALGLQTISWINQQNSQHFTLQLLGTYNKSSLVSFVKKHQLEKDTAFFVTQRNNRNWYTLIHGRFTSKQVAQEAIAELPTALQKIRPWIRRFADIQPRKSQQQPAAAKTSLNLIEPPQAVQPSNKITTVQSLDLAANAAWLWSQSPGHYTLQLLGSHQLDALHTFTQKHQLTRQTSFYRTRRNNREWFVLLYGSYAEHDQAKKAISQLPTALQQTKPWPRSFADIHTELSSQ